MSRPRWARWVTTVSMVVALGALVYTVHDIGLTEIGHRFSQIGWLWFAVVGLEASITTLDAIAMRAFLSPEQDKVRWRDALLAQLAGRAVNAVMPTGNIGEAVKVSVLVEHSVPQSAAIAAILLYNIVSFMTELAVLVIAVVITLVSVPLPSSLQATIAISAVVCLIVIAALYLAVRGGILVGIVRNLRRVRLISKPRFEKWQVEVKTVDDKLNRVAGARTRDRVIGVAAIICSRATSLTLSGIMLIAVGAKLTVAFFAALQVGGFVIYMVGSLVPMGIGVSEGGSDALFRALRANGSSVNDPSVGVTSVLARRVTLVLYAAIGLFLVTTNMTVKRARERSRAQKEQQQAAEALAK
jgi:uncharacterized protein (TIRG00374 family)